MLWPSEQQCGNKMQNGGSKWKKHLAGRKKNFGNLEGSVLGLLPDCFFFILVLCFNFFEI